MLFFYYFQGKDALCFYPVPWFREMKRDFITHVRDERKEEYLVI